MRVLVVDDESDIRVLLSLYLRARGHEAEAVDSAPAARAAASATAFDALLLDVSLPVEDGPTLLTSLRAAGTAPEQVWLLSALPQRQLDRLASDLDVRTLAKPFSMADLDEALVGYLDGH